MSKIIKIPALKKTILFFLFTFYVTGSLFCQCASNLITNGSFNSPLGFDITAPGWTGTYTPDINDATSPCNAGTGYSWIGTPLPSSDGGTWQSLFGPEVITQNVNTTVGQQYKLCFQYAALGITSTFLTYNDGAGIVIIINGSIVNVTPIDLTPYTWENWCYTFTATTAVTNVQFQSTSEYVGIDGVTLTPANALTLSETHVDASCGNVNGSINLTVAGGTAPYTYTWSNGATTQDITNLSANTYTVTVTDASSCAKTLSVTIANTGIATSSTTNIGICSNQLPYTWNGTAYNTAGTYTKTLVNAAGCDSVATLVLTVNPSLCCVANLIMNGSFNSPLGFNTIAPGWTGTNPGINTPDINDATSPCNAGNGFNWIGTPLPSSDGGTWQSLFGPEVIIQNVNTTVGQQYKICFQYAALGITNGATTYNDGAGIVIIINGSIVNVTNIDLTPYTWENWCYTFTATTAVTNVQFKSTAEYVGIDGVTLTPANALTLSQTHVDATCGKANGSINLTVSGGTAPYTYTWSNGATTQDISNLSANTYTVTVTDASSCTQILSVIIVNNSNATSSTTNISICNNQLPYTWNGTPYNAAGTYTTTLVNGAGCDSVATLVLTVKPNSTSTTNISICNNQLPYTWNGTPYNAAGTYTTTLLNAAGCDSVATLVLTVKPNSSSTTTISICNNQLPYIWNGTAYNATGTYTKTLVNAAGCDSVATLVLTVKANSSSTTNLSICNNQLPYTWNGTPYNAAGTYTTTLVNTAGCDSVATLVLTVKPNSTSTTNISICNNQLPYTWNGTPYNAAGTYTTTLVNAAGCDSIATLVLTVKANSTSQLTYPSATTNYPTPGMERLTMPLALTLKHW